VTQHPGIHSARDLFEKLNRELTRFERDVSADNFANLVITAYSICDWISNDPTVPASARASLHVVRNTASLLVCRDLANGTKHFQLNYPNAVVVDATCVTAFGMGRYGAGPYGVGEPTIQVTLLDGSSINGLDLARSVTAEWRQFFTTNGI
jgi:hypothetical protein